MIYIHMSQLKNVLVIKHVWTFKNIKLKHMRMTKQSSNFHVDNHVVIHLFYCGCVSY